MTNFSQVLSFVKTESLSTEQWDELRRAMIRNQKERTFQKVGEFSVGDRVKFTERNGRVQIGKVTGLNRLTVSVKMDDGMYWRIGASFLKKI